MPDFERVIDDLQYHLADTEEERAYIKGYIAGKNYARREVLVMLLLCMCFGILFLMVSAGINQLIIIACLLSLLAALSWMSSRVMPPRRYKKYLPNDYTHDNIVN